MMAQGQVVSKYTIRTHKGERIPQQTHLNYQHDTYIENNQSINTSYADIKYKELRLNGAVMIIRSDQIQNPLHMDIDYDHSFIKVHFELEGNSVYTPNDSDGISVAINSGQYNFFYLPKVNGTLSFYQPQRKSLEIMVSEDFIRNAFKNSFNTISASFGKALLEKKPFRMFDESQSIPSLLMLIINDIITCSYQEGIKEIYLESKVKEIFSILFSKLNEKHLTPQKKSKISDAERRQILLAEKILKDNLDRSITIRELASLSGVNDYKLKKNFKIVTGKPIFSYLTDMRMEEAKNMLINRDMNISEVAYAVGYKNPQHFTSAFKKKFNYLPSDLIKKVQYA